MEEINKAFSEVYDIVNHMDKRMFNKIPKKFLLYLKENKDSTYSPEFNYELGIYNQKLLKDTRIILSLIYRDYICSKEKRQELIEKDEAEFKEYEEKLKEKYDINNAFENRQKGKKQDQQQMIEYKESIFRKIINKILRFFK